MTAANDSMAFDHKPIDRRILSVLVDGRNVPANIADEIGVTRQYVHQRLTLLEAADEVHNIGRGVYELTDKGRQEVSDE